MASYEDYDTTSANYDAHRKPLGVGVIVGVLAGGGLALSSSRVLDAGCGTGAYLAALASQVKALDGLELSKGMLERARAKLVRHANVTLHEGTLLRLPFDDGSFDAVIVNQVIHHLDDGGDAAFPNLGVALREVHRALREGGGLVLNTCSQEQIFEGAWYTSLIPEAVERLARRYVPIARLRSMLSDAGFEVGEEIVPVGERFSGERYLDPAGPLDKAWRDSDSLGRSRRPRSSIARSKSFARRSRRARRRRGCARVTRRSDLSGRRRSFRRGSDDVCTQCLAGPDTSAQSGSSPPGFADRR